MTDEKKIIKGLDKELMQLIDAEMNDPVLTRLASGLKRIYTIGYMNVAIDLAFPRQILLRISARQ